MANRINPDQIHVDWEQIGGYVNHTLEEWERTVIEAHLAECVGCRQNLVLKIKSLPFQPITLDGEPRTPGMTPASIRCGWGRLIGPYLAGRMSPVERERMDAHLAICEMCDCHLGIYLNSLTPTPRFSLLSQIKQWVRRVISSLLGKGTRETADLPLSRPR